MTTIHTPACDRYLSAAQDDPQFAAMVAEFAPLSDAEIRDRILRYRDDDEGTPVGDFMRRLWPLLTEGAQR
ncbi:hypothetical protein [Nocardia sp. CA-290969]|uniref:hypothetical protein n=1 Tax=Nocardia sp. CA-290969 TaxID=3239986 RepID=UPI003D8F20BB